MEPDHFVKDFGIDSLEKNIGLERSSGVAFTMRNIVSGTNVFTVVKPASGSVAAVSDRFEEWAGSGECWQERRIIQSTKP